MISRRIKLSFKSNWYLKLNLKPTLGELSSRNGKETRWRQSSIWWMVLNQRNVIEIKGETYIWCQNGVERENDRGKNERKSEWQFEAFSPWKLE